MDIGKYPPLTTDRKAKKDDLNLFIVATFTIFRKQIPRELLSKVNSKGYLEFE